MLKAKILKDNSDVIESIYITKPDGTYKTNRSGNPMTIEVTLAAKRCNLDANITNNLGHLIDIRDTATHFYHDCALAYVVYVLGVAALKNYQQLVNDWFARSLLEYNFYVMPLAFAHNFQTLSTIELDKKPEVLANLIRSVAESQEQEGDSDFHCVCELTTQLVSAKSLVGAADIVAKVDSSAPDGTVIVERLQRLIDKYPISYNQLMAKVKAAKPAAKQGAIQDLIKSLKIKGDPQYSSYSFSTNEQRERYELQGKIPKYQTCIYNENAVQLIISKGS